jgi:hypothetical protein
MIVDDFVDNKMDPEETDGYELQKYYEYLVNEELRYAELKNTHQYSYNNMMPTDEEIINEAEGRYPVKRHNNPNDSPYVGTQKTFIHGVRWALAFVQEHYNKLTNIQKLEKKEYILCAANYYNDRKSHTFSPKNISSGFVICGRRHHNCIETFAQMVGFPYSSDAKKLHNTEVQGFLTNQDRFVDRKEAYTIAFEANQIIGPNKGYSENLIGLTSEDLY